MSDDIMIVQSVGFGAEDVEITVLPDPTRKTGVVKLETLIVNRNAVPQETYDELVEAAQAFYDAAILADRNPPRSFVGKR